MLRLVRISISSDLWSGYLYNTLFVLHFGHNSLLRCVHTSHSSLVNCPSNSMSSTSTSFSLDFVSLIFELFCTWRFLFFVGSDMLAATLLLFFSVFQTNLKHKTWSWYMLWVSCQEVRLVWWDSKEFEMFKPKPHESGAQNRSGDSNRKVLLSTSGLWLQQM